MKTREFKIVPYRFASHTLYQKYRILGVPWWHELVSSRLTADLEDYAQRIYMKPSYFEVGEDGCIYG